MSKISKKATEVKINRPSICFHHLTDTVCSLDDLSREQYIFMLKKFKLLGGIDWNDSFPKSLEFGDTGKEIHSILYGLIQIIK